MTLRPLLLTFHFLGVQHVAHAAAAPGDGFFEVPEIKHEDIRNRAHEDRDHNV